MVETKELRLKPEEELNQLLSESQKKLRELRFNLASGKVKNVRTIRVLKKDIARILTILNEKNEIKNNVLERSEKVVILNEKSENQL